MVATLLLIAQEVANTTASIVNTTLSSSASTVAAAAAVVAAEVSASITTTTTTEAPSLPTATPPSSSSLNQSLLVINMLASVASTGWLATFWFYLSFIFWGLVKVVAWVIVLKLLAVWWAQSLVLYVPSIEGRSEAKRQVKYNYHGCRLPTEQGLPFEEYFLRTEDGVLIHTWFIPRPDRSNSPTIIYFHGNAGNIGNRLVNTRQLYAYLKANILLVEYRGYGNSAGVPSEHGFKLDARAALEFIRTRPDLDPKRIFVFGRSLGGAVTLWLANEYPDYICAAIVENTFTSIQDMAITLLKRVVDPKWFEKPLRLFLAVFMTSHWRSIDVVPTIRVPLMFISGLSDELVPPAQMTELYQAVAPDVYKFIHTVPGGEHNTTFYQGGELYYDVFSRFIDNAGKEQARLNKSKI